MLAAPSGLLRKIVQRRKTPTEDGEKIIKLKLTIPQKSLIDETVRERKLKSEERNPLDIVKKYKPHHVGTGRDGKPFFSNLYPKSVFKPGPGATFVDGALWISKLGRKRFYPSEGWFNQHVPVVRPSSLIYSPDSVTDQRPLCTWVGHSTVLVQMDGICFLTDPVWSRICFALPQFPFAPRRLRPLPIALEDLPRLDFVLLSHSHYDHMDMPTIKKLAMLKKCHFFVPLGVKSYLEQCGVGASRITELDWMDDSRQRFGLYRDSHVTVTATPAQHFGFRMPLSSYRPLWCSFVVQTKRYKFFYTGDSGYNPIFKAIGDQFGPFDLAAIPVGAFKPYSVVTYQHMDPVQAVRVHFDLRSKFSIGVHWGTFWLGDEFFTDGRTILEAEWERVRKEGLFVSVDTRAVCEQHLHDAAVKKIEESQAQMPVKKRKTGSGEQDVVSFSEDVQSSDRDGERSPGEEGQLEMPDSTESRCLQDVQEAKKEERRVSAFAMMFGLWRGENGAAGKPQKEAIARKRPIGIFQRMGIRKLEDISDIGSVTGESDIGHLEDLYESNLELDETLSRPVEDTEMQLFENKKEKGGSIFVCTAHGETVKVV